MELAKTGQYSASEGRFNTLTGYVAEMQITAERRQKMTSDDRQLAGSRNSYIVVLGESLAWQVVSEFTDESPPSVVRIEKKPSHLKNIHCTEDLIVEVDVGAICKAVYLANLGGAGFYPDQTHTQGCVFLN